ncbi:hypothetical protein C2E25_04980 [Geothermobacter hydrogeniphilus]|uniref:Uncharacterized protein n=1 Tax=Geothermobacter hydrogeniphilus TaxID=1969733 RepID=A0A2K2HCC6_9BACT|nr:hypothetical protein [Geothermobacter hydrogeniphilus]PNU20944.1 hypothetical protein C2E25_04980 [Geothermobacter hydrogeniphilus]
MAHQHYDLIIAGDAPGARIDGILLGRRGLRVLHLHGRGQPKYLLGYNSHMLDALLDQLQARNCLTTAVPVQLHIGTTCIEIHGSTPWQDEIRREHPQSYSRIIALLDQLQQWGSTLQHALIEIGGSPALNLRRRTRWALACRSKGLPGSLLRQPFADWCSRQTLDAEGRHLCESLLASICLIPAADLSLAEAALAWAQVLGRQSVAGAVLDKLLDQRLIDAGATRRPLEQLTDLRPLRSGVVQCRLGSETVSCDQLLLAARPTTPVPGWPEALAGPALWELGTPSPEPSKLLAPRLLLHSPAGAFQLALGRNRNQPEIYLRCPSNLDPEEQLSTELHALFPSARLTFKRLQSGGTAPAAGGACGERGSIRPGKGLYQACAEQLYPALGLLGEALVALTLTGMKRKGP